MEVKRLAMNITNLELTQATIEIFCGFICLMLAVLMLMNGNDSVYLWDINYESGN